MTVSPFAVAADHYRQPAVDLTRAWRAKARPEQLPPDDWRRAWYVRGGRGAGKTWTGSNAFAELIRSHPVDADGIATEWAVIAPTIGDTRDVCIENPRSGLLKALGLPRTYHGWNRSQGQLRLETGQVIYTGAADDGADRIQGKNLAGAWCDEIGMWERWQDAWDEALRYAVRISPAKIVATGTPKATRKARVLIKRLIDDVNTPVTLLLTEDNAANLDAATLLELEQLKGTRHGRQELLGELLDDVEGALWTFAGINAARVDPDWLTQVGHPSYVPFWQRKIVALDPSDGSAEGDEQGLAVVGLGSNHELYVLDSQGLRVTPWEYLNTAVDIATEHAATIVMEKNHGSEYLTGLFEQVLRKRGVRVPYKVVVANPGRGKMTRAEPVAGMYERGKVHHVGEFPELEAQMTSWTGKAGEKSPDRLDALVWGLAEFTGYALGDVDTDGAAVTAYEGMPSFDPDIETARW